MSDFEVITKKKLVAEDKDHKHYLDVLDEVLLWMEQYVGDDKSTPDVNEAYTRRKKQ